MRLSAVLLLVFLAFSCVRSGTTPTDTPQLLANDSRYDIVAVREANSPSAAIDAYARAAANSDDPAIRDAFVRRMVQFGLPEMAEAQALSLTVQQPNDGIAWAVAAYMNARRGQVPSALNQIQYAVNNAADDPFVLYTAGQLVAWYDARGDSSSIPQSTRDAVKKIHTDFSGNSTFSQAYASAREAYRSPATTQAGATTQATSQPTTNTAIAPIMIYPPPTTIYPPYRYPPTYTPTYAPTYRYSPAGAYDPDLYWLAGPYYGNWYWWPAPAYIFFPPFCNRHHDGNHHHRGNHHDVDNDHHTRPITAGPKPDVIDRSQTPLDVRPTPNAPPPRSSPPPRGSGGSRSGGGGGGRSR